MKNILKISAAAVAMTLLLNSCIKEATPTDVATEDQVTLETQVRGIPAALVQAGSTGYAQQGAAWDFSLPAIHIATESMTGDLVVTGNIGYDWFGQWGTNDALGADYAVGALTWDNYYTWIMMANNVINLDNVAYSVTPVPEPSTYAMMIAGLLGVGALARRRAKKA